jgi:hypothetical protein
MKFLLALFISCVFIVTYYEPDKIVENGYRRNWREFAVKADATRFIQKCKVLGYLNPQLWEAEKL